MLMTSVTDSPEAAKFPRKPISRKKVLSISLGSALAVALIVIVSVLTGGYAKNTNLSTSAVLVGHHLSGFSLDGLFGGKVNAPWESGRPSVEIFFASYCGPCRAEMPKIAKYLRTHFLGRVAILAIDATDERPAGRPGNGKGGRFHFSSGV
jgi:thiol-disulfide isomerase/thioredoxin